MDEYKTLEELQKIDTQLDALHYREKNLPERDRYQKLSDETNRTQGLYQAIEKKLRDESQIQKKIEDELDTLNRKIDKEQKRLYSGTITNPKELTSVQQELTHLKEQADVKETELLEQIDVVDGLKSDDRAVEKRLNERKVEVATAKAEMDATLADIKGQLQKLQAEREPVVAGLSEEIRELYGRVRTKQPLAVTVLEEGLCLGCRVELPSTEVERIEASKKIERCPNCSRILVKR
ncbi:MAG: zinc ribbon domain-containing protein [Candidatus Aquicultor sp.]